VGWELFRLNISVQRVTKDGLESQLVMLPS
jgi:hypothetical protein